MTATTATLLVQALVILLLLLRLRRQRQRWDGLASLYCETRTELERMELIYLGKRPWVKGWL